MAEHDPHTEVESGEDDGIDIEHIRQMGGLVVRAVRRRPVLAVGTFVMVATLGLAIAATMPRLYSAQVKLLAQRNGAIRVLSSPHPQMDTVDNPTQNVSAMILRRDNLVSLAKDSDLVQRFDETRPRALKLKDRLMTQLFGRTSDEDKLRIMVYTLEKQLVVEVSADDAMTITVDWSNPAIAYDLVTLVQKNFLEARYDSDVAVINDSISVLEEHAKGELAHVDEYLADYQKLVSDRLLAERKAKADSAITAPGRVQYGGGAPAAAGVAVPGLGEPDPDVTKALEDKRLRIRGIEEGQRHAVEGLRQQLMQAQVTLTPAHPTVIALQQQLEMTSQPSPELAQLKSDERALMAQIVPPRALPSMAAPSATPTFLPFRGSTTATANAGAVAPAAAPLASLDRDGALQLAQSKLGSAIGAYQDATARIDAARVELDITRAVYKHRYVVVTPAEVPSSPKKATTMLVGAGSVVGAALLAMILATFLELVGGRVLEPWQVRRRLKLDVLAELDNPN